MKIMSNDLWLMKIMNLPAEQEVFGTNDTPISQTKSLLHPNYEMNKKK